jgi:hypothetical protein
MKGIGVRNRVRVRVVVKVRVGSYVFAWNASTGEGGRRVGD